MRKITFLKWVRLDKGYILSCVLGSFAGAIFVTFLFLLVYNSYNAPDLFHINFSSFKACGIIFMLVISFSLIPLIVDRYMTIAAIANSTLNDIEKMPEEEVTENLKFLINIMIKDEETRNRKLKEIEDFTKKEDSVAELYTWIRRTQYVS